MYRWRMSLCSTITHTLLLQDTYSVDWPSINNSVRTLARQLRTRFGVYTSSLLTRYTPPLNLYILHIAPLNSCLLFFLAAIDTRALHSRAEFLPRPPTHTYIAYLLSRAAYIYLILLLRARAARFGKVFPPDYRALFLYWVIGLAIPDTREFIVSVDYGNFRIYTAGEEQQQRARFH